MLTRIVPPPSRGLGKRFHYPIPAHSGPPHSTQAHSTNGLPEIAKLAGMLWSELECGGGEHKMSTIPVPFR